MDLRAQSYGRTIELELRDQIVLIEGDSGTGKTLIFKVFKDQSILDNNIVCINKALLRDTKKNFITLVSKLRGKIILVDNADIILTSEARKHIMFDEYNQYVILGRNSDGLPVSNLSFTELVDTGTKIYLRYKFE